MQHSPVTAPRKQASSTSGNVRKLARPHHLHSLTPSPTTPSFGSAATVNGRAVATPSTLPSVTTAASASSPDRVRALPVLSPASKTALTASGFGGAARGGTYKSTAAATAARSASTAQHDPRHTKSAENLTASVVVVGHERDSVAFRLCCEALAGGCVQTYMQLFQLAHRDPVCVDAMSHHYFTIPDNRLSWVQQQLSAVEVLRRQSEFPQVLDHCEKLAHYFEGEKDLEQAMWHYETGLQYMTESLDRALEQQARQAYAAFEERHGRFAHAASLYETMYQVAVAVRDAAGVQEASACLVRVYQALGEHLRFRDPSAASAYFAKAAKAAERGRDGAEESAAYAALGDVSEARGDMQQALVHQRNCRAVAHRDGLQSQECQAMLRVADLEERSGAKAEAAETLQEALRLARTLEDPRQLCNATLQLGEAYRSRGEEGEALACFQESFTAAMDTGDQELVDKVRIAMGFAKGDHALTHAYHGEGYLRLVCTDIRAQLAWMSEGTL